MSNLPSSYDTWRTQPNPREISEKESEAQYEALKEKMEEFVESTLDNVPDHDFAAFSVVLAEKLPEHVAFRRKQRAQGAKLVAAKAKYSHLPEQAQMLCAVGDIMLADGTHKRRAVVATSYESLREMGA